MVNRSFLLTLISITTSMFSSCHQKLHQADLEKTLLNTLSKFPQLPKGQNKQISFYRLVRSVTIGDNGIELQLRSTPDSIDDPQKIIIVTTLAQEQYAIPLFSNSYKDYWAFQFDSVVVSVKPTHTTFEKELKTCLTQLSLYDTLGTAGKVIDEMLVSLLQCERITDTDSSNLQVVTMRNNYQLPYEERDSCFKRNGLIWQEINRAIHAEEFFINNNIFWDHKNDRVYLFDFQTTRRKEKLVFSIKNYRLDCVCHAIDM